MREEAGRDANLEPAACVALHTLDGGADVEVGVEQRRDYTGLRARDIAKPPLLERQHAHGVAGFRRGPALTLTLNIRMAILTRNSGSMCWAPAVRSLPEGVVAGPASSPRRSRLGST